MTSDAARELAERSCEAQGLVLRVTDPVAIGRIADLLAQKKAPAPAHGTSAKEVRDATATPPRAA